MNTVLLYLNNNENQKLLEEMLSEQYRIVDTIDTNALQLFDLCIIDGLVLDRHPEQIRQIKKIEPDMYLPIMLLTSHPEPDLFYRNWWEIIDDVVETPIQKPFLNMRIKVLLRARNQSIELAEKNATLIETQSRLKLGIVSGKMSFFEIDPISGSVELSDEWKQQLGCPSIVANNKDELFVHIHPDDLQVFKDELDNVIQNRSDSFFLTCRIKCHTDYAWFQLRCTTFYDKTSNRKRLLMSQVDITEQKAVEIQYRERGKELEKANLIIKEKNRSIAKDKKIFDTILDTIPLGILHVNNQGTILSSSRHFKELFGDCTGQDAYKIAQKAGIHNISTTEIDETKIPLYRSVKNKEYIRNEEVTVENVQGKKLITQAFSAPLLDETSSVEGGILVFLDITKHKQLQMELLEAKERYRSLFDSIDEGFCIIQIVFDDKGKPVDYIFLELNPSFTKQTGIEDAVGKNIRLITPLLEEYWFETFGNVALTGQSIRFTNEARQLNRWFSVYANRFGKPEDHQVAVLFTNVTEQITSELRLRESEENFHTLADNISQLAWMADPQGEIFWYNKRWYDFTGTTWDVMKKEGIKKIIHEDHFQNVMTSFQEALIIGSPWEYTFKMLKADGSYNWFLTRAMPIRDSNGKIVRWFGTNTDITELRNLQDQLRNERELLQTIFDSIPAMLVIFDPENNRFSPNNFFEQVTGYTTEDMNSPDFYERLYPDPDYREKVIQDTNSYFTKYRDYVLKDKNGNDLDTSWANIEIPVGRHIGIGIDIRERKRTEKELRIAAERFQRISLSNIIGTAIVDFEGNIYFANDYFLNTIGYDQGDLKNNRISWREITPKEFLDIDNKAVQELKYKSVTYPFEKQYIKKDGSRVWVVVSGFLLPGQDTQVFSFILNITDRKHALEIAEQRRAEIEAILNSLPDGYIIYGQDGSIRQMNERAQSILGISGSKNILSFKERLQKVDYLTVDGRHFSVDQVPSSRALRGEIIRDEVMHIQQPDRNYWISVSASPIHIDGKTLGAIIEFSDITNIHNLQDQLAEERNFVNAILQISGALIAVLDRQTHFVRFNKACEQLSGYSAEEVIGKSIFDLLIIDEEKEIVSEVVKKLLAGSTLIEIEHHVLTKSGEKRFIRWRKTVLWNKSGLVEFIIMTGIDISDRKKLYEELSISNRDLESFSYSVSHDLRGPLSVVEGFVTALREDFSNQLGDEGREYLQLIDRSVIRMQQLITSILNLSSAGRQEIKQEDVNLSEMVQRYLQQLQRYEPRRKAEFIIQPDIHAFADLRLLQVALENLLRNSWKFCSKKEITRIEFGTIYDIGSQIYYIRDNGAGFDMHFAKKLFEPFGRLHGEKEYSGTGIGLSIVLRVIVRHGGKIWAEGEVGKGATFYFTLRI